MRQEDAVADEEVSCLQMQGIDSREREMKFKNWFVFLLIINSIVLMIVGAPRAHKASSGPLTELVMYCCGTELTGSNSCSQTGTGWWHQVMVLERIAE